MTAFTVMFCRGLFSRSSEKQSIEGWKLFGKVPAKEARENDSELNRHPVSFDRGDVFVSVLECLFVVP